MKVNFPVVLAETADGYKHHGYLFEPAPNSETIVIHFHGTAGNFYQSTFYPALFSLAEDLGIACLTTNSRGTGVYDIEQGTKYRGAAIEIFEECLLDIDAWIQFALRKRYKKIILAGHSFGTNKIQYYALNGNKRETVQGLILLGFTDSYGGQLEFLARTGRENADILREASELVKLGKPLQLLRDPYINWGELPQAAASYLNFMSPGSALSKILPLRQGNLENFRKISVPMVGIVGDHNEATVIPPRDAADLVQHQNRHMSAFVINGSNHSYAGKENEMKSIIKNFLLRIRT